MAAAVRADGHVNRWWLDPVHGRGFPADMREPYGVDLPEQPGDPAVMAQRLDYLGINYYFRQIVTADPDGPAPYARQLPVPGSPVTGMDWEVYPDGLEDLLVRAAAEYGARRLYVTESGAAWPDTVDARGEVHDAERTAYLEAHLAACGRALARGVPLAGHFAWSLMDNFEWAYGYAHRFGLVHVDCTTQRRTVKTSGRRYTALIAAHKAAGTGELSGAVIPRHSATS